MMFPTLKKTALLMTVIAALSSCGKQSFDVIQSQESSGAAGSTTIAPKIDIVLAVDNSGSTLEIESQLRNSIQNFLVSLNNQGWDFRVTTMPLIGAPTLGRIAASKFDANYPQWVEPYPGAPRTSSIPLSNYSRPEDYQTPVVSAQSNGMEPGLRNIGNFLALSDTQNQFLRPDAALAVVVIGNGDDTSYIPDGQAGGCANPAQVYYPGTNTPCPNSSVIDPALLNNIRNAKGAALASTVHFFPVVGNGATCFGEVSKNGTRYRAAGSSIGGHAGIDLCTAGSVASVLNQLKGQLQAIQLNFVKNYIQISKQPNESTITVTKHALNGAKIIVPPSVNGSAGWRYVGYTTVYMIRSPIPMDQRTGYMIELVGSAYELTGSETADVEYKEFGAVPSH
ncbi:MAG: hypothetical protein H7301_14490 [Cryobacterium sp.]|nr:hypothetical protein [Oligoflexia bacterium]